MTPGPVRRTHRALVAVAALSMGVAACAGTGRVVDRSASGHQGRAAFLARVDGYMAVHAAASESLPPLPSGATAEQIDARQRALARTIEGRRAQASPGDVFTSDARAYFRSTLRRVLSAPEGPQLLAAIMDENPGRAQLRINGRYPETLPLSTVPYQVLAALPPLPEALEYRFIGARLVLFDAHAHLVVDYMDDALPD
jgi:hypothetical protein